MLNTIDDKNFNRKDYVEALKSLNSYVLLLKDNFGFTGEEIDFKELKKELYSDIKAIRKILKETSLSKDNKQFNRNKDNKHKRLINNKRKLEKLYVETKRSYPPIVIKKGDKFFVRVYNTSRTKSYYKKSNNKLVRRMSNKFLRNFGTCSIHKGNAYKRYI